MTAPEQPADLDASPRAQAGGAVAFAILLASLAARPFIAELPFSSSMVQVAAARAGYEPDRPAVTSDRSELARVSFAVALLAAGAVWLLSGALAGGLTVRNARLAAAVALFAAWSLAAALNASNRRAALNGWIEQVSLMAAGWLAIQLCANRRRFAVLVVVPGALGGAMAIKGGWQVGFEVPARIEDFEMHRSQRLAEFGWAEGTPQAALIESRLRDSAPFGFFALANLFASLLILLVAAAVALAADKLLLAARRFKARTSARRSGEIDLPILSGILTSVMAAAAVVIFVLTRSRGGVGAAAVVAPIALGVYLLRGKLAAHWRKCVVLACVVFLLGAAGVVAFGLIRDSLPTRTMTFRWYYWTASAKIVRDRPLLGVGPGNFAAAYLRHRRAAAEEEIKMPHNAAVHAACQYGLPGGALYVGIVGCLLVLACRPAGRSEGRNTDGERPHLARPPGPPGKRPPSIVLVAAGVSLCALAVRAVFVGMSEPAVIVMDAALPAAALAGCILLAAWSGEGFFAHVGVVARVALPAALVAFVLHNMVTFSLWSPGTALVFWVTAGACVAQGGADGRARGLVRARWPVAALGAAGVIAAGAVLWLPVFRKTLATDAALSALSRGRAGLAAEAIRRAAEADPLDGRAAADAAKTIAMACPPAGLGRAAGLKRAYQWAKRAIRRDAAKAAYHRLAARMALEAWRENRSASPTVDDALAHMAAAVELDPHDARLRLTYARMLIEAGRMAEGLGELRVAESIEARLLPDSVEKFKPAERREIELLKSDAQRRRFPQAP